MTTEVGRFPDKRLKAIRKHKKTDSNVRFDEDEVAIVSRIGEVGLERDVIEAVNLWNLMLRFPDFRKEVYQVFNRYFQRSSQGNMKAYRGY
jgi:hypothetical protein